MELLVSLFIVSVALTGLTEVLWLNSTFSIRVFNSMDSAGAVQVFLEVISKDIRAARNIGDFTRNPANNAFPAGSSNILGPQCLILQVPAVAASSSDPNNGFPLMLPKNSMPLVGSPATLTTVDQIAVDTIVYQVVADQNNVGRYKIQRLVYPANVTHQPPSTSPAIPTTRPAITSVQTVLTGVIGPTTPSSGGLPLVFQYSDDAQPREDGGVYSQCWLPSWFTSVDTGSAILAQTKMAQITGIVITLEVKKDSVAPNSTTPQASIIGLRQEYFMRNHPPVVY